MDDELAQIRKLLEEIRDRLLLQPAIGNPVPTLPVPVPYYPQQPFPWQQPTAPVSPWYAPIIWCGTSCHWA